MCFHCVKYVLNLQLNSNRFTKFEILSTEQWTRVLCHMSITLVDAKSFNIISKHEKVIQRVDCCCIICNRNLFPYHKNSFPITVASCIFTAIVNTSITHFFFFLVTSECLLSKSYIFYHYSFFLIIYHYS